MLRLWGASFLPKNGLLAKYSTISANESSHVNTARTIQLKHYCTYRLHRRNKIAREWSSVEYKFRGVFHGYPWPQGFTFENQTIATTVAAALA